MSCASIFHNSPSVHEALVEVTLVRAYIGDGGKFGNVHNVEQCQLALVVT